jgi:hypothetical protein
MVINECHIDDEKLDTLASSYREAEDVFSEESDEHLDVILDLQQALRTLTRQTADVNNELEAKFNSFDQISAKKTLGKLTVVLSAGSQLNAYLKRALPVSTYSGIESCVRDLYVETKQLAEFAEDIIRYKLQDITELRELINEIK